MIQNYSKSVLQKVSFLVVFLFLSRFCIIENTYSQNHWNRDYITVSYDNVTNAISIKFEFIDYEFGQHGERAFLEMMEFCYLKKEGHYENLMKCEVKDQIKKNGMSIVYMKSKLSSAKIQFFGCYGIMDGSMWTGSTDVYVFANDISNKGFLTVVWHLPAQLIVNSILVRGQWHINGLNCSENIDGVIYQIPSESQLITEIQKDSKPKKVNDKIINPPKHINLKVCKEADYVVIKGADVGQSMNVYATAGILINHTIATENAVNIKLPKNQIYIVQIGHARFKITM